MADDENIIQLYPPKPSVIEALEFAAEAADDLESVMIVGIDKNQKLFHCITNGMSMLHQYALAGLMQAWIAERSMDSGWKNEN
jgi:hypothetical protein